MWLCGISAALRETCVLVNSSEMSPGSSMTLTAIRTERLFAHGTGEVLREKITKRTGKS